MTCSPATTIFAYIAAGYLTASIVYLIATRCVGTPFSDSLTEQQRAIKAESACVRRKCFYGGVGVAALALALWRPFQ